MTITEIEASIANLEKELSRYQTEADSKKLVGNGTFGKLGSQYSILYSPDLMLQVTITGQLGLLMLIEMLELARINVVSANTDGIIIKSPNKNKDLVNEIVKYWENVTGFETEETIYKAIYSRDINAYLALKQDGTFKGKNSYFDPWSGGTKEAIFRFHKNPVNTICIEAAKAKIKDGIDPVVTIRNCTDIRKFLSVRNVKGGASAGETYLGKTVRWYYSTNATDCLRTEARNKVPDSEGAMPCMILPDTFPLDIDYEKYEKETEMILENIGYTKRLTLFDLIEG